jgi:hypothetical protein
VSSACRQEAAKLEVQAGAHVELQAGVYLKWRAWRGTHLVSKAKVLPELRYVNVRSWVRRRGLVLGSSTSLSLLKAPSTLGQRCCRMNTGLGQVSLYLSTHLLVCTSAGAPVYLSPPSTRLCPPSWSFFLSQHLHRITSHRIASHRIALHCSSPHIRQSSLLITNQKHLTHLVLSHPWQQPIANGRDFLPSAP